MHIKVDDVVEVMVGQNRGTRGKVLRVLRGEDRVVVEGVNRVYRHVRRSQRNLQGGRLSKEMPVAISNVRLVCPACGRPSRTGIKFSDDGGKLCVCKKCQATIRTISPAHAGHAKK